MKHRVFISFDYDEDVWRAAQVKNMGVVDGDRPAYANEWEQVKRNTEQAIKRWIDQQMQGRSCCVVLIGSKTASSKWVLYEIAKAWNDGMGVLGIYIHNLEDREGKRSPQGDNPFDSLRVREKGITQPSSYPLSKFVKVYNPDSRDPYSDIKENLNELVTLAIITRKGWGDKLEVI